MATTIFHIHPKDPQRRLIFQAVEIIKSGGVIAYPTDSAYALGCRITSKAAMDRMRQIRQLDDKHYFTLVCRDLSEIATYAKVSNPAYRLLKAHTPGSYTFLLNATKEVPRRLWHPKRKTIGIRIPDNKIALMLLEELGEPLISSTLKLPGSNDPLIDPNDIYEKLENRIELVVDGGACGMASTSVIDLSGDTPIIVRKGKGDVTGF